MPLPNMTPAQLLEGARQVAERFPGAELVKNAVGNLIIEVGGEYVGYLNLRTGEATIFADDESPDMPEPPGVTPDG